MLTRLRDTAYRAISSARGDTVAPLRWAKGALRYANDVTGRPLATAEELARREAFEAARAAAAPAASEQAPIVVYHLDKHARELGKITQLLDAHALKYQVCNVEDDEPTREAIEREGKGYGFPVVFIAGEPVGNVRQLVDVDLPSMVFRR